MTQTMNFLLLHGFAGSGASWERFRTFLPGSAAVLAPDLLGHGDCGLVSATFADEVERLTELVADGGPWHLVGYSMGARLALGLALHMQDHRDARLASVSLIGANPGLGSQTDRVQRRGLDERWARLLEAEGLETFVDEWRALDLFASQRQLSEEVLEEQRQLNLRQSAAHLAEAMRRLSLGRMPDYGPRLAEIEAPMLWVAGAMDEKFSGLAEQAAAESRDAEFELVDGVGHNVVLEAPELLAGRILSHVEASAAPRSAASRGATTSQSNPWLR